jgi:hypothetical protein
MREINFVVKYVDSSQLFVFHMTYAWYIRFVVFK